MWYCVITGKGQEPRELTMACKVRRRRADAEHIRPEEILMETNEKEDLYDENLEQEDSDRLSGPDDVYRYGSANVCSRLRICISQSHFEWMALLSALNRF